MTFADIEEFLRTSNCKLMLVCRAGEHLATVSHMGTTIGSHTSQSLETAVVLALGAAREFMSQRETEARVQVARKEKFLEGQAVGKELNIGDCFRLVVESRDYASFGSCNEAITVPKGCVVEVRSLVSSRGEPDSRTSVELGIIGTDESVVIWKGFLLASGDFIPNEKPTRSRENCIKEVRHGGAAFQFEGGRRFCLTCQSEVTEEDLAKRVNDLGGPGHWLGCKLPKNHDGDCLVARSE